MPGTPAGSDLLFEELEVNLSRILIKIYYKVLLASWESRDVKVIVRKKNQETHQISMPAANGCTYLATIFVATAFSTQTNDLSAFAIQ